MKRQNCTFGSMVHAICTCDNARAAVPSAPVPTPLTSPAKSSSPQEPSPIHSNPDIQVWVNTHSGVYHCPNTHWYGATKSGVYLKQGEAQQKGYRPAYHRVCR